MSKPLPISRESLKDKKASIDHTPAELTRRQINRRNRTFWNAHPLGRTMTLRNKTGKTIAAVGTTAAGMATGINIEPIISAATQSAISTESVMELDLNYIELILMAVTGLIGFLTSRELVKGLLSEILEEVRDIVEVSRTAKEAESPGGEEVTDEEAKMIRKEMDDLVEVLYKRLLRSRIARIFGIHPGR